MELIGRVSALTAEKLQLHRILLICLTFLIAVAKTAAQEPANYQSAEELQRAVTLLLGDKNINDVTTSLDGERPSSVSSLLRRLVIYGRAGQTSRVRATLKQLSSHEDWRCEVGYDLKWLIRNADTSLDGLRFFYERICPDATEQAEEFISLWNSTGDPKALDSWLAERSRRNDEWLMLRVQLRAHTGTAGEVLDGLAADVRSNPTDWTRLDRYVRANNRAGDVQDLAWLADTFVVRTAGDYFQLGGRVRGKSPQAGAKLLSKSLEIPFTDADAKMVVDLITRYRSAAPSIKTNINLEKQLRYWTKRSLAEAYQRMNQSLAAQPLMEELVAMKGDDILLEDLHQLAGAVQGGSGQRVIETKILGDEAAQHSTAQYWLERASYYHGRKEYDRERDSYREALVALRAKSDAAALNERFKVVQSFAFFLDEGHNKGHNKGDNRKEDKQELEELLTNELSGVPPETIYAFQVARLITRSELELDDLRNSLLANRPSFLARVLGARSEWQLDEEALIKAVVNREAVPSSLKEKIWSSLESVVREPGSTRTYFLAAAMQDSNEWHRAIPLWRGYIEHASPANWEGYKADAAASLFTAYCRTKQWQAAEKLLFAQPDWFWRVLPKALAEVAVVAAQQNAVDDAMRLWRMSTNLDRRNLETLPQLAQTKAKPHLLAMYLKMKKEDPLSTIPDLALRVLQ